MASYLGLLAFIFLIFACVYGIVDRICKCIDYHTEWKYRAKIDLEWMKAQKLSESGRTSDRMEG